VPVESVDQAKIDATIRQWREVGSPPTNGNNGFFRLGRGLLNAGLSDYEIERILKEEARLANTPKDRRRSIPQVMRSLRRHGTAVV
jgi:hypothetical protein